MQTALIDLVEIVQNNRPLDGNVDITAALPQGMTLNELVPVMEFLKQSGWTGK